MGTSNSNYFLQLMKKKIVDNIKTILWALLIALFIRSFFFQPFYIPSSSMEPNLLIGDRLFVSKYTYGFSRHSFPFSPNFSNKRFFSMKPERGDIIVFKTPADNRTDYIKRLIGLPNDTIQFIDGKIFLNEKEIVKEKQNLSLKINCGGVDFNADIFEETLPNGTTFLTAYNASGTLKNSDKYVVPEDHYFFMGDNRDCSKDSRFLGSVGYVNFVNLVGKARVIFFSNDKSIGNFFKFWKWNLSLRLERFFKKIK